MKKTNETFLKEVHDAVGDDYSVLENYITSQTKIKFKHNICGNEFDMVPNNFLRGQRCPKCSHKILNQKLTKTTDQFKKDVFNLVGDEYTVLGDYVLARLKIKFKHNICGNEFDMAPNTFLSGHRCPKCAIKRNSAKQTKTSTQFKKEVYNLVGNEYTVLGNYKTNNTKIKFKHNICGNEFDMTPAHFLNGQRCTSYKCSKSKGEAFINKYCLDNNIQFEREFRIKECINPDSKRKLPFDFKLDIPNSEKYILIEYDGMAHYTQTEWFGGKEGYAKRIKLDNIRTEYCKSHAIPLIRIHYYDYEILTEVMDAIVKKYNLK